MGVLFSEAMMAEIKKEAAAKPKVEDEVLEMGSETVEIFPFASMSAAEKEENLCDEAKAEIKEEAAAKAKVEDEVLEMGSEKVEIFPSSSMSSEAAKEEDLCEAAKAEIKEEAAAEKEDLCEAAKAEIKDEAAAKAKVEDEVFETGSEKHEPFPRVSMKEEDPGVVEVSPQGDAVVVISDEKIEQPRKVFEEEEEVISKADGVIGGSKKDVVLRSGSDVTMEENHVVPLVAKKEPVEECGDNFEFSTANAAPYLNPRPITAIRPGTLTVVKPPNAKPPGTKSNKPQNVRPPKPNLRGLIEDGEFAEEPDWFLVDKSLVYAMSTCRGWWKLEEGEIVHIAFPKPDAKQKALGRPWVSAKVASATSEIVRFSTKRCGEIGRLPAEWGRCLIPLVNSSKVKVQARCVLSYEQLQFAQDIVLYVSFYIHRSIFKAGDNSSWKLQDPSRVESTVNPILALFRLLNMKPFKKAEFTPEELDSRKRSLNLKDDQEEDPEQLMGLSKRRKGPNGYIEQANDEQAVSQTSLNKLVGAAEVYNLKEAEPPSTLSCTLRPYQKQALFWMTELEKGLDAEQAARTLHPCWEEYTLSDRRATAVYVNVFSGDVTTTFPSATQMARGGILADAMGLGKTVMTIALILGRTGKESSDSIEMEISDTPRKKSYVKGGTLIVCPMALLGQWKDELEAHSSPDSISIFVHYGGERTSNPRAISDHDVVLTTYGVLASEYKHGSEKESIYHKVEWHRVVLDEAHTIKCSKTGVAQAAFSLVSHCRWCLTGTPIQNKLEDLYSLLCFLHVEPWCNWAWWQKLIQRPYESGDERGLRLVKAILRPLMLRRTKETKDREGRPILVLPPVNIQVVECEQSEAECDFYQALFKKSKVRFDQFVAQGKVLHNYANILELLLRLRQCCNHPFLVMSRGDTDKFADLDKLARRFFGGGGSLAPSAAYVEEVVDGMRNGEFAECPICLESASDDPVLTPCAHRMCRECLLSSWRTPAGGPCPVCRRVLSRSELITCPSEGRFRLDVEKNWTESSKVAKLMECLLALCRSGEKSIVFSQWTSFLDLLEIPLRRKGVGFLRFDGKLAQKQRERVLKEFSECSSKPVLLMSLKAGGVGLNLTAASNVFLMDPWWNPAVEEQAIMRIHRIGQKREVRVRRFIVKETVEERMQQVQARKQRMIAGALTDEEVRSARLEELKMLFT